MIPQGFIQDLLARVDIVDVVGRHVALKKAGQNFLGLCPFHGEKTPSFTVSPSKQFFHCFGCGAHGSAIGFLMEHRGLGYVDAIRDLAQSAGMQVPEISERATEAQSRTRSLTELLGRAADFYREQLKQSAAAVEYLKGRGLTGQTAARFALGYAPDSWQPLRDACEKYEDPRMVESGLVIADEGKRYDRSMTASCSRSARAIRSSGSARARWVVSPVSELARDARVPQGRSSTGCTRGGVTTCRPRDRGRGYMDVIQLAQAGFEDRRSTRTAVTSAHVNALLRVTDHVIFAFGSDAAGRKRRGARWNVVAVVQTPSAQASSCCPRGRIRTA
jgi:DNA primase